MLSEKIILNNGVILENSWKRLSIENINEVILFDFPGKKRFIDFYLYMNGGTLAKGAYIHRNSFYEISKGDYTSIEVSSFFYIPLIDDESHSDYTQSILEAKERREGYSEVFDEYISFHIPFADNFGDNDFWIDVQTGEVKYIDYESSDNPNDAIIVAPSFDDFCKNLQPRHQI